MYGYLLSKLALSLLLALGPIFITLILFDSTKRFFESWLGQTLNYGLLFVLTVSALQLLLTILQKHLDTLVAKGNVSLEDTLALVILVSINLLILRQIPSIAAALGGGVALATQGAFGNAFRKMNSMVSQLRPTHLNRSYHQLKRDVVLTKQVVSAPLKAAGSAYQRRFGGNSIKSS